MIPLSPSAAAGARALMHLPIPDIGCPEPPAPPWESWELLAISLGPMASVPCSVPLAAKAFQAPCTPGEHSSYLGPFPGGNAVPEAATGLEPRHLASCMGTLAEGTYCNAQDASLARSMGRGGRAHVPVPMSRAHLLGPQNRLPHRLLFEQRIHLSREHKDNGAFLGGGKRLSGDLGPSGRAGAAVTVCMKFLMAMGTGESPHQRLFPLPPTPAQGPLHRCLCYNRL